MGLRQTDRVAYRIETHVADDAISCVAYGTGKSLEWLSDMQDGTINISRRKQMNN
jgi:rod shape-determining protein MreB